MIALALLAHVAVVPAGETFTCTPVRVWDADGPIWCAEGPRVRLDGIAAREMDGDCLPGHPCPAMNPLAARARLVALLAPKRIWPLKSHHIALEGAPGLSCTSSGSAKGNRTSAICRTAANEDIGCALIAAGAALEWRRYSGGRYASCRTARK